MCDQKNKNQVLNFIRAMVLVALLVGVKQHAATSSFLMRNLNGTTSRIMPGEAPMPPSSKAVHARPGDAGDEIQQFASTLWGDKVAQLTPPKVPSGLSTDDVCRPFTKDDNDFRKRSGLFCIVAGMEHSSTTVTSSMIMSAPNLIGAFEGGLLVPDSPAGFNTSMAEPYWYDHMVGNATARGGYDGFDDWGLTLAQRERLTNANCHAEQYVLLREQSPLFSAANGLHESWVIDKTPSYFRNLLSIMDRTPNVPVIVTQKSDEAIELSYVTKHGMSIEFFKEQLEIFKTELAKCKEKYPHRVHVVNHTEMLEDVNAAMSKAFAFLELQWVDSYASREPLMEKVRKVEQTWLQSK